MTSTKQTPFGLLAIEEVEMIDRGYVPYPEKIIYDPTTQVTNLLNLGGKTEPTTTSQCADTTGVINRDSDEANDDTGTD